jgi:hypothetical protein
MNGPIIRGGFPLIELSFIIRNNLFVVNNNISVDGLRVFTLGGIRTTAPLGTDVFNAREFRNLLYLFVKESS